MNLASDTTMLHLPTSRLANYTLSVLVCFVANFATAPSWAAIPASERAVLIAIYNNTNGDAWTNNTNWCNGGCPATGPPFFTTPGTECSWYGVACDLPNAHVVGILLSANNLVGQLPSITDLTALTSFYTNANHLSGMIPALAGLSSLREFAVNGNLNLIGSIPDLSGLTALTSFVASDNRLSGPMPNINGLTGLQEIALANNQLGGTIPALANLPALEYLDIGGNQLTGSIPDLSQLSALRGLRVGYNRLSGTVPAPPSGMYTAQSSLCPNPFDLNLNPYDGLWSTATGLTPWWGPADAGCDLIFSDRFGTAAVASITLIAPQGLATPNGNLTFSLTVANVGDLALANVGVTDNQSNTNFTVTSWTCAGNNGASCPAASGNSGLNHTIAALPVGGSLSYTISGTVAANPTPSYQVSDAAAITVPNGSCNDMCFKSANVATVPIIAVAMQASETTYHTGDAVAYTITLTNDGGTPANGLSLTDSAPSGVTFDSWTCTAIGTNSSCPNASGTGSVGESLIAIDASGSVSYAINGMVTSTGGAITNTATAGLSGAAVCAGGNCSASATMTLGP